LALLGSLKVRTREKSFYKVGNSVKIHNKNKERIFFFENLSQKIKKISKEMKKSLKRRETVKRRLSRTGSFN
jgi:seryl-tRNA synthetase